MNVRRFQCIMYEVQGTNSDSICINLLLIPIQFYTAIFMTEIYLHI